MTSEHISRKKEVLFFRPVARRDSRHKPLPVSSSLLGKKLQRKRHTEREGGKGRKGGGVIKEALGQDKGPGSILQFQMLNDFILVTEHKPLSFPSCKIRITFNLTPLSNNM